jgi:hypothetical protein
VREQAEVAGLPVLSERPLDEGLPDTESGGDLFNDGVAMLDGGDNFLPQV